MKPRHSLGLLVLGVFLPACGSSSGGGGGGGFRSAPGGNLQVAQDAHGVRCVADGVGGAFLAWYEALSPPRIRIQRVDASGRPAWAPLEVVAKPELLPRSDLIKLISDGSGAAVLSWSTWEGGGSPNLFAQRISAAGEKLWGPDGLAVVSAWSPDNPTGLSSDGNGGAILTWMGGFPMSSFLMVYAQRIDPNGVLLWPAAGVPTGCWQYSSISTPGWTLCSDGAGGAQMVWLDEPWDPMEQQRIDASGNLLFGSGGRTLPGITTVVADPKLYPGAGGGALLTWTDYRDNATTGSAIYLYHLDAAGDPLDAPGGLKVAGNGAMEAYSTTDGGGGAFIGYSRQIGDPTTRDVYLQHMDVGGAMLWGADGLAVCTASDTQTLKAIEEWPGGGAVLLWEDFRSQVDYDLYAGRVDAAGVVHGEAALSAHPWDAWGPCAAGLGGGKLLVAWGDAREGSGQSQVCLQLLDPGGVGTPPLPPTRVEGPWYARNVPGTLAPSLELSMAVADDGQGGTLIVWGQNPGVNDSDLYAQRLDASSQPLWGPNGIVLCDEAGGKGIASIVADGTGGAFICWGDGRNSTFDIYGQRLDAAGTKLWAPAGLPLLARTDRGEQEARVHSDGAGGIYVAYTYPNLSTKALMVQRFDGNGAAQWAGDGTQVVVQQVSGRAVAVPDGTGGSILTWTDLRNATPDLYAQRVDATGAALWTAGGTSFVTAGLEERLLEAIPDGAGGAWMAWEGISGLTDGWRRVDSSGAWSWTAVDTSLLSPGPNCTGVRIEADGSGGAFLLWADNRTTEWAYYVQRVDGAGTPQWAAGGIVLTDSDPLTHDADLAKDGSGGVYVIWVGAPAALRTQRFDGNGTRLWSPQAGVEVASRVVTFSLVTAMVLAGPAGPRMVWPDYRRRTHRALYGQSLTPEGAPLP